MDIYGQWSGFEIRPAAGDPRIAIIEFNQPERLNPVGGLIKRDLVEALAQIEYRDKPHVIIFAGQGGNFSAGDSSGRSGQDRVWDDQYARSHALTREHHDGISTYSALRTISQAMQLAVRNFDKLTIAAIDGYAIQSGLSLALQCDFRIATARAKLGSATLRMGFQPDEAGHWLLVQYLGVARTKEFLLRKQIVGGEEALRLGLVNELVEPEALMTRAMELATELADGPQVAMRLLKHAVENAYDQTIEQAGRDIAVRTAISDHHGDAAEGVRAFRARDKPNFNQSPRLRPAWATERK